jgi:hypothetical protein
MGKIFTRNYTSHLVNKFIETLNNASSNNSYYLFTANHVERISEVLTVPKTNIAQTHVDAYRNMLFGKKISNTDIMPMIRKIDWESGKVFTMYDDSANSLYSSDFYCAVDEGSFHHVYKCLDNNSNTESSVEPQIAHIAGANTDTYRTSDGYVWKYMYSVTDSTYNKFSTSEYIPVVANTEVVNTAIDGAIDVIKVVTSGRNYGNYLTGTFTANDVRYNGNNVLYQLSNNSVSTTNGYYTGCLIYLSSGTGSGQYKNVVDYFSNTVGNFIQIDSSFDVSPTNGTEYEINPKINIVGDGNETNTAIARALVNAVAANAIYRVEMLNKGANYSYIKTNVIANSVVGVTANAVVRGIYSPPGGHGSHANSEFGVQHYGISVEFSGSESNTIVTTNSYDRIGILKDPEFANVVIEFDNANSIFIRNEQILKINPSQLQTNATTNSESVIVSSNTANFSNQVIAGEYVYLRNYEDTEHMLTTVAAVTNSISVNLASNCSFSCTDVVIFKANTSTAGYIESVNSTHIVLSNTNGEWLAGDTFIGLSSSAKAQVNTISRSGIEKGFNTFVQLYKYKGTLLANTFTNDEKVYQGSNLALSSANATLHSAELNGSNVTIYTSNQVGQFTTSLNISGANSTALASISDIYKPELVFGSGEVLYMENVETINRNVSNTETIKFVFSVNG